MTPDNLDDITTIAVERETHGRLKRKADEIDAKIPDQRYNTVIEFLLDYHDSIADPGESARETRERMLRMRE